MPNLKDLQIIPNNIIPTVDTSDASVNFDVLSVGWWTFDKTLDDSISGNNFSVDNGDQESYTSFKQFDILSGYTKDKFGLSLEKDVSFSTSINGVASSGVYSLNIGFWYYAPSPLGFVRHAITKRSTPRTSALIAKAETYEDAGQELVVNGGGEWIICEVAYSKTQNCIQVALCHNGSGPTSIFTSEPYDPGLHHIYINLETDKTNSKSYLRIDIDGKYGTQHMTDDINLLINNTNSELSINKVNFGYKSHQTINVGSYISNLIIQKKSSIYATKTLLMMRFGPEITLTSDTEFPGFNFFGIGYNQPTTITTKQIFSDGGSIFVARSNGDLMKGYRPIWDNEFGYKTQNEVDNLEVKGTKPEWTLSGVKISDGTIRI